MKSSNQHGLETSLTSWLRKQRHVRAAILFGSRARQENRQAVPVSGQRSDVDFHLVSSSPAALETIDWASVFPCETLCLQVVRPATGDVRKVTAIFGSGEVDLVIVPLNELEQVQTAVRLGLHLNHPAMLVACNEIATWMQTGYRFVKGERIWGSFYRRILAEMPGVRVSDVDACAMAGNFLCELVWVLNKLQGNELCAAQYRLHRSLAETNFRLIRELRFRRGEPVPSFGLGRHLEKLLPPHEVEWVKVDARLEKKALFRAAMRALHGLQALMKELVPCWDMPKRMEALLAEHPIVKQGGWSAPIAIGTARKSHPPAARPRS